MATRYRLHEELGRGGMAVVFRATELSTGRAVALKRLLEPACEASRPALEAWLEREFQILAELSHPKVIQVYDYGLTEQGPYYTMELLEGGDMREHSPMPWKQACELIYDVASSLALLHSRGLVHRDVSPRNVRCAPGGSAKLIDFGAMARMGVCEDVVGTPDFIAPEVMRSKALDARTDIFSLGATLYFALTGRPPFPAAKLDEAERAWSQKPAPPSEHVHDVPGALDRLVMSSIRLDPARRIRSAFEVMQRLAAVARIHRAEPLSVAEAYLSSPVLVGREAPRVALQTLIQDAHRQRGCAVRIEGEAGIGRSRMLQACVLDAKTRGLTVLEAGAQSSSQTPFAVAQDLVRQVLERLPERAKDADRALQGAWATLLERPATTHLALLARSSAERAELQRVLSEWILRTCHTHPVLIAVDDVDRIDEPSAALLTLLADRARPHRLLLVITLESHAPREPGSTTRALVDRTTEMSLKPLSRGQTHTLLESIFRQTPNARLLGDRIHAIADGNPRQSMDLLRFLIDRGLVRYAGGGWTLPDTLEASQLPKSARQAFLERVAGLPPSARTILQAMALASYDGLTREECGLVLDDDDERVESALAVLLAEHLVERRRALFTMVHRVWSEALEGMLDEPTRRALHTKLATLYDAANKPDLAIARHELLAGREHAALARIARYLERNSHDEEDWVGIEMRAVELAEILEKALAAARRLGSPRREVVELLRGLTTVSATADARFYWMSAPEWLRQIEHDSGLHHWHELQHVEDATERLTLALQRASEQYQATPEHERVYAPDEAIHKAGQYVGASIAIGACSLDARLLGSLPALLEPFAPLSPILEALWQSASATYEGVILGRLEQARERWLHVLKRLEGVTHRSPALVRRIRSAVRYGIGTMEGRLGLQSVMHWADLLEDDPLHRVDAMHLRKIACLQKGDWEGAEAYRKRAETEAVRGNVNRLFTTPVIVELGVAVLSDDLVGVKQCADQIEPFASRYPGWEPYRHLARGHFERMRGNFTAALESLHRCSRLCAPESRDEGVPMIAWPWAVAASIEALMGMERWEEARQMGEHALTRCAELDLGMGSHVISRALALAEAALGDHAIAGRRLEALIDAQRQLGVTGLNLGASYEARARVAMWAADKEAIEVYMRRTADAYRHGAGSPLGARYERLVEEARRAGAEGVQELPRLEREDDTSVSVSSEAGPSTGRLGRGGSR